LLGSSASGSIPRPRRSKPKGTPISESCSDRGPWRTWTVDRGPWRTWTVPDRGPLRTWTVPDRGPWRTWTVPVLAVFSSRLLLGQTASRSAPSLRKNVHKLDSRHFRIFIEFLAACRDPLSL